jgi:hypothetical protein
MIHLLEGSGGQQVSQQNSQYDDADIRPTYLHGLELLTIMEERSISVMSGDHNLLTGNPRWPAKLAPNTKPGFALNTSQ